MSFKAQMKAGGEIGCWASNPRGGSEIISMSNTFDFIMTEHVAWRCTKHGYQRVLALPGGGQWLVKVHGRGMLFQPLAPGSQEPQFDTFDPTAITAAQVPGLASALQSLGLVARLRTADLWEAVGTAIIRQVIRAAHAKRLYLAFCDAHGPRGVLCNGDGYPLFPSAEVVAELRDEQFASIGMAFKRRPLRSAAEAYLKLGERWRELPLAVLVRELQEVPRIGAWTAGAAVADFSNDFTHYPHADLAVRTWAQRAAPAHSWPSDEKEFGQLWRTLGDGQLGTLTLLTLAWGNRHGDTS